MNYLLACEQLTEKYYKYTILFFIGMIFLFGFIFGVIVGEYQEMVYINKMINDTAYGIPINNILKTDSGYFIINPYIEEVDLNNWSVP